MRMCNLYNITTNQRAIIEFSKALRDLTGNLEPELDIFPDLPAPIVRNGPDGQRELVRVRWGMPSSSQVQFEATKKRADRLRAKGEAVDFNALLKMEPDRGTTNIRNTASKHWSPWLGPGNRCVVPFTCFAEPDPSRRLADGRVPNTWFALNDSKPLAFFAGIWAAQWQGVRKIKEGLILVDLFAFLTTEPNGIVAPVHPKAMPVILTDSDEVEMWLRAPLDRGEKAAASTHR
jgi:putative SOS response-associated peptidase YedK